jgi:hypothetical protein
MGDALPRPGIAAFHLTFVSGLHVTGGVAPGATPVISGPRHWGQFWSTESRALADVVPRTKRRIAKGERWIIVYGSPMRQRTWYELRLLERAKASLPGESIILRPTAKGYDLFSVARRGRREPHVIRDNTEPVRLFRGWRNGLPATAILRLPRRLAPPLALARG